MKNSIDFERDTKQVGRDRLEVFADEGICRTVTDVTHVVRKDDYEGPVRTVTDRTLIVDRDNRDANLLGIHHQLLDDQNGMTSSQAFGQSFTSGKSNKTMVTNRGGAGQPHKIDKAKS